MPYCDACDSETGWTTEEFVNPSRTHEMVASTVCDECGDVKEVVPA